MEQPRSRRTWGLGRPALTEILTTSAILGSLAYVHFTCILPAVEASRPRIPPTIPGAEPGEDRRVYLPSGLSIIRPPGWEVVMAENPERTHGAIKFDSPIAAKPVAYLRIDWSRDEPSTERDSSEIVFQGRPARMTSSSRETVWAGRRGQFRASLVMRRDDRWVTIHYAYFDDQTAVPDIMWRYFETLECPPLRRAMGTN